MTSLPSAAQRFITGTFIAGIVAFGAAWCVGTPPDASRNVYELLSLVALSALIGWKTLPLARTSDKQQEVTLSIGFVLMFWAMLRFGVRGAVLTVLASVVVANFKGRQVWYQVAFNLAQACVQAFVATEVFILLNGGLLEVTKVAAIPAVIIFCLIYFLINTGAVAQVIALCTKQPFLPVWRENFLWLAPGYLIGAALCVLGMSLWTWVGNSLILLTLVPFLLLVYLGIRVNRDRIKELSESQEKLANMYEATTRSLALAVDAKDHYTHQHILRVQAYSLAIARAMNFKDNDLKALETGALLHDVGKVGIPEAILLKPGRLTAEEFAEIKRHPVIGAEILEPVPFPYPVIPIVRSHHERWDGTGYPDGLKGDDIPLTARILAVADVYDALTTTRAYRSAWTHQEACNELQAQSGKHFDPAIVSVFLDIIDDLIVESPFDPPLNPAPLVDERLLHNLKVSTSEPILRPENEQS